MRKGTWLRGIEWLCRLVVVAIFFLAAIPKLYDPASFARAIVGYRFSLPLIGQDYVYPAAIFLPALEFVAALALLANPWKRAGSLIAGGLLIFFIALISQAVARGLNIDCGCFGIGAVSKVLARQVGVEKIIENAVYLGMCFFVWWRGGKAIPQKEQ